MATSDVGRLERATVGVISDTHGLLRPEAVAAFEHCDLIVHAGDVGSPEVLDGLGRIAPVVAIRGNVDRGAWADPLPWTEVVEVAAPEDWLASMDMDPEDYVGIRNGEMPPGFHDPLETGNED